MHIESKQNTRIYLEKIVLPIWCNPYLVMVYNTYIMLILDNISNTISSAD